MSDWKMPEWMEPYRDLFNNTGGNSVEELQNSKATIVENAPMAMIAAGMKMQVHNNGLLKN